MDPGRMQVGCGFRIKSVHGTEYVYFWRYEARGGRRRQVYEYMGPRRAAETATRLGDAMESYYARASEDLRRQLIRAKHAIASLPS